MRKLFGAIVAIVTLSAATIAARPVGGGVPVRRGGR